MFAPDRIALVVRRRRERAQLAAVRRVAARRAHELDAAQQVVPTQGDLICFNVSIRPC